MTASQVQESQLIWALEELVMEQSVLTAQFITAQWSTVIWQLKPDSSTVSDHVLTICTTNFTEVNVNVWK